ncbi:MAG TPA: hypothetical protein VFT69_19540, partial [Pseudolabrys sp.]|nr:hypothetical protein [Pseudolabrys sp.]
MTRVLEELEAHRPWFVKEPRLCLILPLLQHLQHQVPVFIHVWRRPLEVAQSLSVRNGFPLDFGLALWEAYVRAAFAASRGRPSLILSYNDLVSEPRAQTERLVNKLRDLGIRGLTMPEAAQIEDAVDANLHRNRSGAGELAELITPSQQRLLDALAGGEPGHPAFFESLSAVSQRRLADWTGREGVMLELRRAASDGKRAAANAAKLQAEIGARTRDIALLNDQVAERARDKDAFERELGEQRTRLHESDNERKLVLAALARRDEELADAKAALAQALEARKEAAEAVRALQESQRRWGAEHDKLAATLTQRDKELQQIRNEAARAEARYRSASETAQKLEQSRQAWDDERKLMAAALARRDAELQETRNEAAAVEAALARAVEEREEAADAVRVLEEAQRQWGAERERLAAESAQAASALHDAQTALARERERGEQAAARAEKLEADAAENANTVARLGARIAALKYDIRQTDDYLDRLKLHFHALEETIEGQAAQR